MTGIIHFDPADRISRRTAVAGAAGLALTLAQTRIIAARTPEATPQGATRGATRMVDARDRLRALLGLVPADALGGTDPTGELFSWVDYETHFTALGVADPYDPATSLVSVTSPLVTTDALLQYAMAEDVSDYLGFRVLNVSQVLVAGAPPEWITIYAGGVRFADITGQWETSGYERKSGSHGDYWTIGENAEMDLGKPGPIGMGSLNNVALLADDIAVFTPTLALLESVLAHVAESGSSAADDERLALLIDVLPADTVNVLAVPGELFRADTMVPENPGMESSTTVEDLLAESDGAVGPMPPLLLSLSGITAGAMAPVTSQEGGTPSAEGNPGAHAFMAFLLGSEDDARAAAEVAYWRLENMQSPTTGEVYNERFVPVTPEDDAVQGEVMLIRFDQTVAGTGAWYKMVFSRDTWPFAWLK